MCGVWLSRLIVVCLKCLAARNATLACSFSHGQFVVAGVLRLRSNRHAKTLPARVAAWHYPPRSHDPQAEPASGDGRAAIPSGRVFAVSVAARKLVGARTRR
ncbi:MAG: hypothetical protein Ta2A_13870 [Treponemataceae bacterium]|nr:MAG: hypothetical protein Ta2A_13870 [Treponemataceae bacterium]